MTLPTATLHAWADAVDHALDACGIPAAVEDIVTGHRVVTLKAIVPGHVIDKALRQGSAVRQALAWSRPVRLDHDGRHLLIEVPLGASARWVGVGDLRQGRGMRVHVGFTTSGAPVHIDLAETPNIFLGGQTRSGKTNAVAVVIHKLATQNAPSTVRFALCDLHRDQLAAFDGLPHLRWPRATTPDEAARLLVSCDAELDARHAGKPAADWLIVVVDEVQLLTKGGAELLRRLATGGAKRRVLVIVTTQYKVAAMVDPVVTGQCTVRICCRVDGPHLSTATLGVKGAGGNQLAGRGDALLYVGGTLTRMQTALWTPEDAAALPSVMGGRVDAGAVLEVLPPSVLDAVGEVELIDGEDPAVIKWAVLTGRQRQGTGTVATAAAIAEHVGCGTTRAMRIRDLAREVATYLPTYSGEGQNAGLQAENTPMPVGR